MTTAPREFQGRDLVEALQEASRAFGVKRSQLGHELLDQTRGGAKPCIIRAWPRAQWASKRNVLSSSFSASSRQRTPASRADSGPPRA